MPLTDLQTIVEDNPTPFILDPEEEAKAFSHKSLFGLPAHVQVADQEPRDWERLAFLGDQILAFCTTEAVFERYPNAKPSYLTVKRNLVVNNEQVAKWSQAYGFPQKIRAHPSQLTLLRANVTARASVFEAVIGAIFVTNGMQRIENWLKPLIRHALDEAQEEEDREKLEREAKWQEGEFPDLNQRFTGFSLDNTNTEDDIGSPGDLILPTPTFGNIAIPNPFGTPIPDYQTDITSNTALSHSAAYSAYPLLQEGLTVPRDGSNTPKASRGAYSAPSRAASGSMQSMFDSPPVDPRKARSTGGTGSGALGLRPNGSPSTLPYNPMSTRSTPAPPPHRFIAQHPQSAHSSPGIGYHASPTYSTTSTTTNNGFLALFNQIASQKHVSPTWTTDSTGPPHKPTFEARVIINGEVKGKGTAYNKQTARHIAAKQALKEMGWHAE